MDHKESCMICGKPLFYTKEAQTAKCEICGKTAETHATCESGHFVCDECHGKGGIAVILNICKDSESKDPIFLLQQMMAEEAIHMHGPEHHMMVGAALITAFANSGGVIDKEKALTEMIRRGSRYPGGSCGFWGCCGAAASTGMFFSIITETTPLSTKTWGQANAMTSEVLRAIAAHGGPRCCKRNSFTAAVTAVKFIEKQLHIKMELPETILCDYSALNKECIGDRCPYHK